MIKIKSNRTSSHISAAFLSLGLLSSSQAASISLGSASSFAVIANQSVTSTSATVNGNLGVSTGTSVTGSPVVNGSIYTGNSPASAAALADAQNAYNQISGLAGGVVVSGDLGVGPYQTLVPGVYDFTSSAQLTGTLTLSGSGLYTFRIVSSLTTAPGSLIILAGGASASDVFFQVGSSATLGSGSIFNGNILSQSSATLNTSTVNGTVAALTGTVALNGSTVTVPEASTALFGALGALGLLRRRR